MYRNKRYHLGTKLENPRKEYTSNKHLVYSCQYHVIFCPKYRRPVLEDKIARRLKALIYEKQDEFRYKLLEIEVLPDHVHLLLDVNPRHSIYTVVNKIKGYTSRILRQEFPTLRSRLPTLWTRSKFISSVGAVTLTVVKQYITEQKGV